MIEHSAFEFLKESLDFQEPEDGLAVLMCTQILAFFILVVSPSRIIEPFLQDWFKRFSLIFVIGCTWLLYKYHLELTAVHVQTAGDKAQYLEAQRNFYLALINSVLMGILWFTYNLLVENRKLRAQVNIHKLQGGVANLVKRANREDAKKAN